MDIRLVKNFQDGKYIPVNEQLLLQSVDCDYQIGDITGKQMFLFNPSTNERLEIQPDIDKFDLAYVNYASVYQNFIIYTSAQLLDENQAEVLFYKYDIATGSSDVIHKDTVLVSELKENIRFKTFVLDDNYCIFEKVEYSQENLSSTGLISKGLGKHTLILKDISKDKEMILKDSILSKSGIEKIIPFEGNLCYIKIGSSQLEGIMFPENMKYISDQKEIIGVINIKQFISELLLNQDNGFIEILDESSEGITYPYMKQFDNYVVYSKVDVSRKQEEVIIYDYVANVKKVRLNSNIEKISDLNKTYLIDENPYIIKNTDKSTELINLNTQKIDLQLTSDVRIKYIRKDLIVTQKNMKKFILSGRENHYVEVFRYPDMKRPVFKTRARYKECISFYDDLLIFTE